MLSIATLALTIGLMFVYAALNPDRQILEAGRILAKKIRAGLLSVIMVLSVSVGYWLPVEVAQGFQRLNERQAQQQIDRAERKMAAERRHTLQMITIFGGREAYLTYLSSKSATKPAF